MEALKRSPGRPRREWAQMDAALDGALVDVLLEMDRAAMPWPHMALELAERTGVSVTDQTIRNWVREIQRSLATA